MPIRVACTECDKKLSIRDELAGKKVKCPGCGSVFIAAAAGSDGIKAAPPRSAPPATKDKVSAKPMAKRPAPPPIEDDEDEDMDDRPVRKGKKSAAGGGSKLWLWLVLAGVLVVGGAAAAYFVFFNPPSGGGGVAKGKGGQGNPGGGQGGGPGAGQGGTEGANVALGSLADMVPGDAFFFASLSGEVYNAKALESLKPLFGKQLEDAFQKETGFPLTDLQTLSAFSVVSFAEAQKNMKVPPIIIVAQTNKPVKQPDVSAAFPASELGRSKTMAIEFAGDQTILVGAPEMLQVFKARKASAKATGVVERALAKAATSKGAVVAINIPPEAAKMAGPLPPGVPPDVLKTSAVFAALDLTDKLHLQATLTLDTPAAAADLKRDIDALIGGLPLLIPDPKAGKVIQQLLADLKITTQDKDLSVVFQTDPSIAIALILPAIQRVREASASMNDLNNLKIIGLAWHNYMAVNKTFPPQTVGKGLSWRVAILPYIEQENLYRQFNLNEPWDSPQNKRLIPLMPKTFESAGRSGKPGFTFYQTFVGPNTTNPVPTKGSTIAGFRDGTSNTIIVAESDTAVEWTKPADITVTPNGEIRLGSSGTGGYPALYGDASVRRIPRNVTQQILRWLIDPIDGNVAPNY